MVAASYAELVQFGWGERVEAEFASLPVSGELAPARVVRVVRSACAIATVAGERMAEWVADLPEFPVVGDWVAIESVAERTIVRSVMPRWSELIRLDPLGDRSQVLAVNVDIVLITAPADRPSAARVERESVVAWESGARPVVVVTKVDLDAAGYVDELRRRLVGVEIIATSAATGAGMELIVAQLRPSRTAVLLGPSGAGKSTLINALLGEERLATGAVRDEDARGRHTTTTRELVVIPTGGVVIDTPGIRGLGMWSDGAGLEAAFSDVTALAEGCRFRDCRHDGEPGCAVLAALAAGELDAGRFDHYRKLDREIATDPRKLDPAIRRAEREQTKAYNAAQRRARKHS